MPSTDAKNRIQKGRQATEQGPPPTGHVLRFIDSGVFVLPVGGPSRSLLEVRGAPWVALPVEQLWMLLKKK